MSDNAPTFAERTERMAQNASLLTLMATDLANEAQRMRAVGERYKQRAQAGTKKARE